MIEEPKPLERSPQLGRGQLSPHGSRGSGSLLKNPGPPLKGFGQQQKTSFGASQKSLVASPLTGTRNKSPGPPPKIPGPFLKTPGGPPIPHQTDPPPKSKEINLKKLPSSRKLTSSDSVSISGRGFEMGVVY